MQCLSTKHITVVDSTQLEMKDTDSIMILYNYFSTTQRGVLLCVNTDFFFNVISDEEEAV